MTLRRKVNCISRGSLIIQDNSRKKGETAVPVDRRRHAGEKAGQNLRKVKIEQFLPGLIVIGSGSGFSWIGHDNCSDDTPAASLFTDLSPPKAPVFPAKRFRRLGDAEISIPTEPCRIADLTGSSLQRDRVESAIWTINRKGKS